MFRKAAVVGCSIVLLAPGFGPARARANNAAEPPIVDAGLPEYDPTESVRLLIEAGLLLGLSVLLRRPESRLR